MKTHVIYVEPAQYTLDLIKNVYPKTSVTFLHSTSKALDSITDLPTNVFFCDKHSWFENFKHFLQIGIKNQFIISNGYTHWSFRLLFLLSFFKKLYIGIESDTPYSPTSGIKKIAKYIYLHTTFKRKTILGLSGGNGTHMDLFLKYGMDKDRIFLLPMMIDNQKYYPENSQNTHNSSDQLTFLYVGRLDPEKNVEILIDAFIKIFKDKDVQLFIVGSGSCEIALRKRCTSENIIFKGKLFGDELRNRYHQSDILVLPSLFEPWGLVINEALAAGLAIICSNAVGAAIDLVVNPNSGWVFETGNNAELESLFLYCENHRTEVKAKGQNGIAFMKNHWSYQNYVENLKKVKAFILEN